MSDCTNSTVVTNWLFSKNHKYQLTLITDLRIKVLLFYFDLPPVASEKSNRGSIIISSL